MSQLYDKRNEPDFVARIRNKRLHSLQHISTCLLESCKWNIPESLFVCLSHIILDTIRDEFVYAHVGLLRALLAIGQGYPWVSLQTLCLDFPYSLRR